MTTTLTRTDSTGKSTAVSLTDDQLLSIYAALFAVSPVGGGSPTYSLAGKIGSLLPGKTSDQVLNRVAYFCTNVVDDAIEAGVVVKAP